MEKRLRCKDCKMLVGASDGETKWSGCYRKLTVNPGQFACCWFHLREEGGGLGGEDKKV